MRIFVVMVILILVAGLLPAGADGVFAPKWNSDPKSHAGDISEPVQKALIVYDRGVEHLVLQVSYKGSVSQFAWLVPTPSQPRVSKVDRPIFHWLHNDTAPQVRYWFDADLAIRGMRTMPVAAGIKGGGLDVHVLEEKQVGAYDIAVLRAGDAGDLLQWLRSNGYKITPKLVPVISDYIRRGWVFTAMRINIAPQGKAAQRLHEGVLQSLKFTFRAPEPVYPLKISSLNSGRTNILLYVIANRRLSEPMMATECSLDYHQYKTQLMIEGPKYDPKRPYARLTKLTANLTPEQMTHDLVLKPTRSNDVEPIKDVSPPFLENVGASSFLLLTNIPPFPSSLVALGIAGLVALSPFGRKRWRVWLAAGIIFALAGVLSDEGWPVRELASYCRRHGGYSSAGIVSLTLVGIVVAATAIFAVRRKRLG